MNRNARRSSSRARNVRSASGMSRGVFLRTAGIGAAGVGAAMMGMSGVARATSPMPNRVPKVAIVHRDNSAYNRAAAYAESVLRVADVYVEDFFTTSVDDIKANILGQGFNVIIGVNTSTLSGLVADAIQEFGAPVHYIECGGTADDLNPMYQGSEYTMSPLFFHRTAVTSSGWGFVAGATAIETFEPDSTVEYAFIRRLDKPEDGEAPDKFGLQGKAGFDEAVGSNSVDIVIDYWGNNAQAQINAALGGANANKTYIVGCALNTSNSGNVFTALAGSENPNLYAATIGTIYGSGVGTVDSRTVGLHAHWDESAPGYTGAFLNDWYVDGEEIGHRDVRALDAAWLVAASLRFKMPEQGEYQLLERFSSPKGTALYPYKANLSQIVRRPSVENINYEGASGPIDFMRGELSTSFFQIKRTPKAEDVDKIISSGE